MSQRRTCGPEGSPRAGPGSPQDALIAFLGDGRAYRLPAGQVDRITTHAAVVFLIGERAYKMKRAVRYSFLDFTTLGARHRALEAELELNRRTAPMLYRRLVPVTREDDGRLALDGAGRPVEWLLEMRRFDQEARLDRIAARGALGPAVIDDLAMEIARFHELAVPQPQSGGIAGMREVIEGNAVDFAAVAGAVLPARSITLLTERCRTELARQRVLLEERRWSGRVRHCHGDLHLGNIVLLDGTPVLFDCLEFDPALASIDTMYDLAFLLMDLEHQSLGALAQRLLNGYLDATWDDAGVALLPLFLACRAAVRAKVLGLGLPSHPASAALADASDYLARALGYLVPAPPRLVAIGGRSGTGKSTLARRLAPDLGPAPGAVILRSDVVRKRLHGVAPTARLGPEAYRREVTRDVYRILARRADALIQAGHGVIVDAVFLDPAERAEIGQIVTGAGVRFQGFWLDADPDVLLRRVAARRDDASDATTEVLRRQLTLDPGPLGWRKLDASGSIDAMVATLRTELALDPA